MKPIDEKQPKVTFRALSRDAEGGKRVEKIEVETPNIDTLKYINKKLKDKGVQRMDRHPVDQYGGIGRPPPKSGHGGKYTWEGPVAVIDDKDPNYIDKDDDVDDVASEYVVGEVQVPKVVEEGVGRIDVIPPL